MGGSHLLANGTIPVQNESFNKVPNTVLWEDVPEWVRPFSFL